MESSEGVPFMIYTAWKEQGILGKPAKNLDTALVWRSILEYTWKFLYHE